LASSGIPTISPRFDTDAPEAQFELLNEIEEQAAKRGVKVETLVNQWLQQKLDEEAA